LYDARSSSKRTDSITLCNYLKLLLVASGRNPELFEWNLAGGSGIFRAIVEDAITTKEFATAHRALLEIATRHVKFAF